MGAGVGCDDYQVGEGVTQELDSGGAHAGRAADDEDRGQKGGFDLGLGGTWGHWAGEVVEVGDPLVGELPEVGEGDAEAFDDGGYGCEVTDSGGSKISKRYSVE